MKVFILCLITIQSSFEGPNLHALAEELLEETQNGLYSKEKAREDLQASNNVDKTGQEEDYLGYLTRLRD